MWHMFMVERMMMVIGIRPYNLHSNRDDLVLIHVDLADSQFFYQLDEHHVAQMQPGSIHLDCFFANARNEFWQGHIAS